MFSDQAKLGLAGKRDLQIRRLRTVFFIRSPTDSLSYPEDTKGRRLRQTRRSLLYLAPNSLRRLHWSEARSQATPLNACHCGSSETLEQLAPWPREGEHRLDDPLELGADYALTPERLPAVLEVVEPRGTGQRL